MKKSEVKYSGSSIGSSSSNPFEQLKSNLRNNIRRLKRDDKEEGASEGGAASSSNGGSSGPYKKVQYLFVNCFLDLGYYSTFQLWRGYKKVRSSS